MGGIGELYQNSVPIKQCCGSAPLSYESGSCSFRQFLSRCQQKENFAVYILQVHLNHSPELRIRMRIRIWIHRNHVFLDLQDPDPLVRGMDPDPALDPDPDPSIIMQK